MISVKNAEKSRQDLPRARLTCVGADRCCALQNSCKLNMDSGHFCAEKKLIVDLICHGKYHGRISMF